MRYSTEPRFRKYVKGYGFLSFPRKLSDKYGKKNKIADKITSIGKSKEKEKIKKAVQIDIPPEKRQQIIETLNCFDHKM